MKSKIITFEPEEDLTYRKGRLVLFANVPIEACLVFNGNLMTKKGVNEAVQYRDDGSIIRCELYEDVYVFIHESEYKHIKEKEKCQKEHTQ